MSVQRKVGMSREPASRESVACRVCGGAALHRYLNLGRTPLANSYLDNQALQEEEFTEELCLQVCLDCGLSQLTKVVPPDLMFRHYLYVSSTTATIREHFAEFAATMRAVAQAPKDSLAVDVASNDGCLLEAFRATGLRAAGVDPAENLSAAANARGLKTLCAYWGVESARAIRAADGEAVVITAANVFAHVDDLDGFMEGVKALLSRDGVLAIECPYVMDFLEKGEFDTAYHEHLSYIGMTPLCALMERHGFDVFDVAYFPAIHGGTIRSYCARKGVRLRSPRVGELLRREVAFGIKTRAPYDAFASRVLANRERLRALVGRLLDEGRVIWAYGASAKGNTLMNFFGLTKEQIPCVVDDNPLKHGLRTPGARMLIVPPPELGKHKVDVLLLLAWNFESEIRKRCADRGYQGDFLVPVPEAHLTGRTT